MKGRPHILKCSKCRRGQWHYPPKVKGVRYTGRQRGAFGAREAACLDCGHVWWSRSKGIGMLLKPGEWETWRKVWRSNVKGA